MDKKRVMVMNGVRLVEKEVGGQWQSLTVDRNIGSKIKAGIYNIYTATNAQRDMSHMGKILDVDSAGVVQEVGKNTFVRHALDAFEKVPKPGQNVTISYTAGRALTQDAMKQSKGLGR